jgi:hypothetical protein
MKNKHKAMKKLVVIIAMLAASNLAVAQTYYSKANAEKPFTFQLAPTYFNYGGDLYGFQLGINYKETLNIGYFHTRNYQFGENFMDDRFSGVQASIVLPITEGVQVGPSFRVATYNEEFQKVFIGAEVRFDMSDAWKFAIEYGKGEKKGFGMKLIWNIY